MPGPALSTTFTYDGTPGLPANSAPFNTLDREVVQSNRFFQPIQIGTHSKKAQRVNIPRNSDRGLGIGGNQFIDADNADPGTEE
jgi:hypothetical protein